jgi:hypothetical protein
MEPSMRYLLAALLAILFLTGCESMDAEDRNFYYSDWMHPEKAANKRLETR